MRETEQEALSKVVLVVEYEGARYHGFQAQPGLLTIQGELESALYELTGDSVHVVGAGRTDAGVHAQGQVVGFRTGSDLSPKRFVSGLNYYLPEDIAVKSAHRVRSDFDVRRDACSREYRYTILNRRTRSPLRRKRAYLVTSPLDVGAMKEACHVLIGDHDFSPFFGSTGGKAFNPIRTVYKADVSKKGDLVTFDMMANSFLPHQVRRTAGALIEVGRGKVAVEEFWGVARSKERGVAGPAAPAYGLCLVRVNYPNSETWERCE